MAVGFQNIPSNLRVPLFHAEVDPSQAGFFQVNQPSLLIGQMLAAGSATANTPIQVSSVDQAKAWFGPGSMLARMMAFYRQNDSAGEVWCLPLEDALAGVAASGQFAVSGTATASGTLSLYIGGQRVQVGVASGEAATVIGDAVVAALSANVNLPVTAANAMGTVTVTAKHKGGLGNDIDLRLNHRGPLGGEALPAGVSVAVTAMSGGSGDPDIATALASLGDQVYDFVACPYTDTSNLDAIKAEWDDQTGRWAFDRQVYGHVFSAKAGTVAALGTFGNGRNDPHVSVAGIDKSPTPPWEIAAAFTAQAAKSLIADPARPLQTLPLVGVLAPDRAEVFTQQERQTLLFDGIATLMVSDDGTVRIERAITTYQLNAFGQADPSFLDVQTNATLAAILRRLRNAVTTKFGRHKLANDGTAFGAGQAIVTPRIIKAELSAQYSQMVTLGLVENQDAFEAALMVERNLSDPNRVDVLYPPDLINQLRIFAVLAQFRLQFPQAA